MKQLNIRSAGLLAIMALILLSHSHPNVEERPIEFTPRGRVLYGDLVIRGIVRSIMAETVPKGNFCPDCPLPDQPFPITTLELEIIEVIKGYCPDRYLTVVAPGGYPPDVHNDAGVRVELNSAGYGYTYDYSARDEYVLVLEWWPPMKGGSFLVVSDEGRYLKIGNEWENQGTKELLTSLDEIRDIAESTQPISLFQEADVVVLGTVSKDTVDTSGSLAETERITLKVDRVWKGSQIDQPLDFCMVTRGGYRLSWRRPVPKLMVGEQWLCFLQMGPEGLFPFAGTNSLLQLKGQEVIRNNNVRCPFSRSELVNMLTQEGGHE